MSARACRAGKCHGLEETLSPAERNVWYCLGRTLHTAHAQLLSWIPDRQGCHSCAVGVSSKPPPPQAAPAQQPKAEAAPTTQSAEEDAAGPPPAAEEESWIYLDPANREQVLSSHATQHSSLACSTQKPATPVQSRRGLVRVNSYAPLSMKRVQMATSGQFLKSLQPS